ncbi:MAG: hypothetical protein KAY78_03570 [Pseudomonadales bacterium]|jgi:hypothetical protein|nr:hypothetical protein [Cellvibrionales bacterium]MBP8030226.1 hypothetical protein [Pseudomonadales bacterium]
MSDKPVDKTIFVLHRMEPLSGHFDEAKKLSEEWFEFMKKIPDCKKIEMICCVESQIAWLEEWTNRMTHDKFNEEHFAYADFAVRMMACSRGVFTRGMYRQLH